MSEDTRSIILFFVLLGIILVTFSLLHESFLSVTNIRNMMKHVSVMALASLGLTFVIVVGHYDMSFPWVGTLAGLTMAYMIAKGFGVLTSCAVGIASGVVWGFVNGMAVGRYKMPDVILTIGTGSTAWGWAYIYSDGTYIYDNFLTSGIMEVNDGRLLGVPYPTVMMLVCYVLAYFFLHRTSFGRRLYATGENRVGAVFSGVRVNAYVTVAFVICAAAGGLATILIASAQGQAGGQSGLTILMPAYASVFLGMSAFKRPSIFGTFLGAILLSAMLNGFTLMSVPFYSMDLIISVTLIIALGISNENVMRIFSLRQSQAQGSNSVKGVAL
jgi:simple sugar transport system permease protein/ribose transport system permease protein